MSDFHQAVRRDLADADRVEEYIRKAADALADGQHLPYSEDPAVLRMLHTAARSGDCLNSAEHTPFTVYCFACTDMKDVRLVSRGTTVRANV